MTTLRHRARSRLHAGAAAAAVLAALLAMPARADLDLVFVLDTTGSMGGELAEAQQRLRQLTTALAAARPEERLRFGVVAFRDRGDAYVTRRSPLSEDLADTVAFLSGLAADGGGDTPESVLAGLAVALREMSWDPAPGTERRVVLVGDAPPHLDYSDEPTVEEVTREARERQIVIDAIGCRSLDAAGVAVFRQLAYASEGSYQHIGRVEVPRAGALIAAFGRVAAPGGAAAGGGEPLELTSRGRAAEASPEPGSPGAGALRVESVAAAGECLLEVRLPAGMELGEEPAARLAGDRLEVTLALVPGGGGSERWAMRPCPPLAAAITVQLGGR